MKKNVIIIGLMALLTGGHLHAQHLYFQKDKLNEIDIKLKEYVLITNKIYDEHPSYLVSTYTFRSLIQKDFSKITIGENSFSKVGRFAAASVNADESKFYFTPFTFVQTKDPLKGPFRKIHAIDLSGDVSSEGVFNFKEWKSLKAGYSLTFILGGYTPKRDERDTGFHRKIVQETYDVTYAKYKKAQTSLSSYLSIADKVQSNDIDKLKKAAKEDFFKTLEEYELNYYDDKWKSKRISWVKFNITPISWDNFSFIDPTDAATFSKLEQKKAYTGSAKASFNQLHTFPNKKNMQIYFAGYIGLSRKHSLSEISTPIQYYNLKRLTDSTVTVVEDKQVYSLKQQDFKFGIRPDLGAQFIFIFNAFDDFNLGFDLASSFNGLVSSDGGAYVNKSTLGILFPFTDKDGESTVNLEIFYQRKTFSKIELENNGLWGVKFGLPFSKL